MKGYSAKDILMKRNFKKIKKEDLMISKKLPKGGFGLEKRLPLEDKEPPMSKFKNKNNSRIDQSILCHTCSNKDICKYQGDYLEQVVHIIDVYDGVFELNCSRYECIRIDDGISDDIIDEHLSIAIHSKNHEKYCSMISAMKDKDDELLKRIIEREDLTEADLK